jgi:hypothetical protein
MTQHINKWQVLTIAVILAFTACGEKNVETETFIYHSNDSVTTVRYFRGTKREIHYVVNGDTITGRDTLTGEDIREDDYSSTFIEMILNKNGDVVKSNASGTTAGDGWSSVSTYQYSNGNLVKYTNKQSIADDEYISTMKYKYDSDGFPTKKTEQKQVTNSYITMFIYSNNAEK